MMNEFVCCASCGDLSRVTPPQGVHIIDKQDKFLLIITTFTELCPKCLLTALSREPRITFGRWAGEERPPDYSWSEWQRRWQAGHLVPSPVSPLSQMPRDNDERVVVPRDE